MAIYTQKGSVTINAFQWAGQALSSLPAWSKLYRLHPSDGNLCVPTRLGTESARNGDWVVLDADGSVTVMPNAAFTKLYS